MTTLTQAAKNFRSGTMSLRQLHFACLDLELHKAAQVTDPFAMDRAQAAKTMVLPPLEEDRFLCAFSHIFAGGYAAGYFRCVGTVGMVFGLLHNGMLLCCNRVQSLCNCCVSSRSSAVCVS